MPGQQVCPRHLHLIPFEAPVPPPLSHPGGVSGFLRVLVISSTFNALFVDTRTCKCKCNGMWSAIVHLPTSHGCEDVERRWREFSCDNLGLPEPCYALLLLLPPRHYCCYSTRTSPLLHVNFRHTSLQFLMHVPCIWTSGPH